MKLLCIVLLPAFVGADFVLQKADRAEPAAPTVTNLTVLKGVGGEARLGISANGFLGTFQNAQPHFRAPGPKGGSPCGKRTRTSVTAKANNCSYATNASPFNMGTGACDCGVSVTAGVAYGTGGFKPGLGTTAQGDWVIGTLNSTLIGSLNVTEFAAGFSWLVRAGKNVAPTGSFVAPRTAIGTTADGSLLSLEVDGCEEFVIDPQLVIACPQFSVEESHSYDEEKVFVDDLDVQTAIQKEKAALVSHENPGSLSVRLRREMFRPRMYNYSN